MAERSRRNRGTTARGQENVHGGDDGENARGMARSTASYFTPIEPPELYQGDVAAVRQFLKKYDEYCEVFKDRVEDGTAEGEPKRLVRCIERDWRETVAELELGITLEELDDETMREYLDGILNSNPVVINLQALFGKLQFDAKLIEPKEKVLRVFQAVKTTMKENRLEGKIEEKEITPFLVKAIPEATLRRAVEEFLSRFENKGTRKSLKLMYALLVRKYEAYYETNVDHVASPAGRNSFGTNLPSSGNGAGQRRGSWRTPRNTVSCHSCGGPHYRSHCPRSNSAGGRGRGSTGWRGTNSRGRGGGRGTPGAARGQTHSPGPRTPAAAGNGAARGSA